MSLFDVKTNKICIIKKVDIESENIKLRIMELGLFAGVKVEVKCKSLLKKTLLISCNSCCFTISNLIAKQIEVCYV